MTMILPSAMFTRFLAFVTLALLAYLAYERWKRPHLRPGPRRVTATLASVLIGAYLAIVFSGRGQESFDSLAWGSVLTGSILALSAIGLTLVYGVLKLSNFSHGDLLTLGAYMAFLLVTDFGATGTVAAAVVLGLIAAAVAALDRTVLHKLEPGERASLEAAAIIIVAGVLGHFTPQSLSALRLNMTSAGITVFAVLSVLALVAWAVAVRLKWRASPVVRALPVAGGVAIALTLGLLAGTDRISFAFIVALAVAAAAAAAVVFAPHARSRVPHIIGAAGGVIAFLYSGTFLLATFVAVAGVVVFVIVLDLLLWRRLRARRAAILSLLIISIGVALALRHAIQLYFGGGVKTFDRPALTPSVLGAVRYNEVEVLIVGVTITLVVGVHLFLKFTRAGKAMRALADNPDLARVSGVNVDRVILYVWMIAGSLAAVAGVLVAYWRPFKPTIGWDLLLPTFAAVILGGIGSALGALAGAFSIAFAMEMSSAWISTQYKQAIAFIILIAVLLLRPQGILGGKVK